MDDITQPTLNETAGEEASISESSAEEPKASGEVETPSENTEPTGEVASGETTTETEGTPKKGASQRIRELNAEKKSAEKRAATAEEEKNSLKARLAELTGSVEPTAPQAQYNPQFEPGAEIDPDNFKQEVVKTAVSAAQLVAKQSEAINRINNETNEVITKFPELDPQSEHFDQELSDSVTEATEAYVRQNPYTASPKKFVERLMKPYQRAVTKEVGKVTENIAKQVSETAMRPTGGPTKAGKSAGEKSIAELEQELGFIN